MRIMALALFAVCAGLAAQEEPGPGLATRTEARTETLAYGSRLWVRNHNGAITVTGWDREELALSAEIRDTDQRRIDLVLQRVGGDLEVEAQIQQSMLPMPFGVAASPWCRMTLSVPHRLLGQFRTINGPISVTSVSGYVRCETTNGDISLSALAGEAVAETTNGNVEARQLHARIKGSTANGQVVLDDVAGRVQMEATNGSIKARDLEGWGEGIQLECTNGAIDLELGRATGDILAMNASGGIRIKVPNGRILEQGRHRVHVKVPGGTQMILLETTNGNITVH